MPAPANPFNLSRSWDGAAVGQIINSSKNSANHRRHLDGFVKDSSKPMPQRRKIVSSQVHQRAEKAQTLMRSGLKRPAQKFSSSLHRFTTGSDIERQLRAKATAKHGEVKRFGVPNDADRVTTSPKPLKGELISRGSAAPASQVAAPLPSMVTSASHQKLERLLDHALVHADAHKQALRYQAARHFWQRRIGIGQRRWIFAIFLIIVIIAGLAIAWEKVPVMSMKVAGWQAHVSPIVPTYQPDGYSLAGPAKDVSGAVDVKFAASGSNSYDIVEAQSDLTGTGVGQNVVPKGAAVQTSQVQGNTVYIYGNGNNAAWVNNGVLYTIADHANLSSDELIKIVQGLNP